MSKSYNIQNNKNTKIQKQVPKYVADVKITMMLENGRKEITTKEELEKYPIGSLISYMNKNNEFKQAGFIYKFSDEYFIYLASDFTTKYRVRYKNVQKMWVGDVYSVTSDLVSLVKADNKKTNFPVKINNIIVYYAKNNFDVVRFKNTGKYKNMIKWVEIFG